MYYSAVIICAMEIDAFYDLLLGLMLPMTYLTEGQVNKDWLSCRD